MAGAKKVLPGQVEKAKKLLQGLPTKDVGITRTEFAATLDKDIRKAINKGYSLKDISALLKKRKVSKKTIARVLVKPLIPAVKAPKSR